MSLHWNELYGTERLEKYAAAKDLHTKRNFLPKGDYNFEGHDDWETEYESMLKDSIKKHEITDGKEPTEKNNKKQKKRRDESIIDLSFGKEVSRTFDVTSRDIGEHREPYRPSLPFLDREVHIADFSPKYNDQKTGLPSTYHDTFNKQHEYDTKAIFAETLARTNDVRSTHFKFGTSKPRRASETYDSSKRLVSDEKSNQDSSTKPSRHQSNIFKEGDWNVINRGLVKASVTAEEFSESRYPNQNDQIDEGKRFFGKKCKKLQSDEPDYVRTHVDFDENAEDATSFYRKDYMMGRRNGIPKPERARALDTTSLLARNSSPVKSSLNQSDFISFNNQLCELDRSSDFKKNKKRIRESQVGHTQYRRKSSARKLRRKEPTITQNGFQIPQSDCLTLNHESQPIPKYRYLDSDAALPKPHSPVRITETKSKHTGPIISKEDALEHAMTYAERQVKDRATHFIIGTEANTRSTENTTQFKLPLGLDPKLPAAGVTNADKKIHDRDPDKILFDRTRSRSILFSELYIQQTFLFSNTISSLNLTQAETGNMIDYRSPGGRS